MAQNRIWNLLLLKRLPHPRHQGADSTMQSDFRAPSCTRLEPAVIGNIIFLVSDSTGGEAVPWRLPEVLENIHQLQKADGVFRSATDVECLAAEFFDVFPREQKCVHQVIHEEEIADLIAIPEYRDR